MTAEPNPPTLAEMQHRYNTVESARLERDATASTEPKRRGRRAFDKIAEGLQDAIAMARATPTPRLRIKTNVGMQQAWQHPTGVEWRTLPVVDEGAADWEEGR